MEPLDNKHNRGGPAAPLNSVLELASALGPAARCWNCCAGKRCSRQQPDGDEGGVTPGVARAPEALAGAIMPGVAKFIVTLSAQAEVFGVGITAMVAVGSMLVSASCAMSGSIVPGAGFAGI